jgi:hypothetical protein
MIFTENKKPISLIFWMIFFFYTNKLVSTDSGSLNGYTEIVSYRDQFIAVGTDGRIDCISKSGESITIDHSSPYQLNCAFSNDDLFIAAGEHGTILVSSDGKRFTHAESGTVKNIHGITVRDGLIMAGTESGILLISNDGQSWNPVQTKANGNFLSLSSNDSFVIGVTDEGEILKSFDGLHWDIQDYNNEYAGYNMFSIFKKIHATPQTIVIIGTHDDGSPSILFSSLGNVWAERLPVYYDDEGKISYLTNNPNDITFDPDRNQFILACDNGGLFSLPDCAKCNKYIKISASHLNTIIYSDNCLLIGGADYSLFIHQL